jgi:Leucine-rich repeat (LRR) protein
MGEVVVQPEERGSTPDTDIEEEGVLAQVQEEDDVAPAGSLTLVDLPSELIRLIGRDFRMRDWKSCAMVSRKWRRRIWKAPTMLNFIYEINSHEVTDETLRFFSQRCQQIHYLKINWNHNITPKGVQHLSSLTNLLGLQLSHCSGVTDKCLQWLTHLSNLQQLSFYNNYQLSDEGVYHIAQLPNLKQLDLSGCSQISDRGVQVLTSLTKLTQLDLGRCHGISVEGAQFIKCLPKLDMFYVNDHVRMQMVPYWAGSRIKFQPMPDLRPLNSIV